jgi:hypothetical protein
VRTHVSLFVASTLFCGSHLNDEQPRFAICSPQLQTFVTMAQSTMIGIENDGFDTQEIEIAKSQSLEQGRGALGDQLAPLGVAVKPMPGDNNCQFQEDDNDTESEMVDDDKEDCQLESSGAEENADGGEISMEDDSESEDMETDTGTRKTSSMPATRYE